MHQPAQLERDVAPVLQQVAAFGAQRARPRQRSGTAAPRRPRARWALSAAPCCRQRRPECGALAGASGPTETGAGERGQQLHPAPAFASASPGRGHVRRRSGPGSSGLSRMAPPGRNATGRMPQASARSAYSPLGSTTQARRPKTAWRQRKVLTKALLPRPICPNTTMFGLETTPGRVELEGVEDEGAAEQVVADHHPPLPKPASAMKG